MPASLDEQVAEALREVEEALGWLAAGLTVWADRGHDEQAPKREVVIRVLRQGESATARLVSLAREAGREEGETWWRAAVEKWASVYLESTEVASIVAYTGKYGGTPSMMLQSIVAAARLAGIEEGRKAALMLTHDGAGAQLDWDATLQRARLAGRIEQAEVSVTQIPFSESPGTLGNWLKYELARLKRERGE